MCKLGVMSQEPLKIDAKLLLSANRKSYMPCRLAHQQMTLSDLEWPFRPHRGKVTAAGWQVCDPIWYVICKAAVD